MPQRFPHPSKTMLFCVVVCDTLGKGVSNHLLIEDNGIIWG